MVVVAGFSASAEKVAKASLASKPTKVRVRFTVTDDSVLPVAADSLRTAPMPTYGVSTGKGLAAIRSAPHCFARSPDPAQIRGLP